jgi:hypothetical protein
LKQFLQDVFVLYCVGGWDEDAEVRHALGVFELSYELGPWVELFFGEINVIIIHFTLVWESVEELENLSFDMLTEPHSRVILETIMEVSAC